MLGVDQENRRSHPRGSPIICGPDHGPKEVTRCGSVLTRRRRWRYTVRKSTSGSRLNRKPMNRPVQLLWNAVRLPIAALLLLLRGQPLVGFVCGLQDWYWASWLAILFEMAAVVPEIPVRKGDDNFIELRRDSFPVLRLAVAVRRGLTSAPQNSCIIPLRADFERFFSSLPGA